MIFWYMLPQGNGYYRTPHPDLPGYPASVKHLRFNFFPDERVAKVFCDELENSYKNRYKDVPIVTLGHESHSKFFSLYNDFRQVYLEKEPGKWAEFEQEAKAKYGFGKYTLPKSVDSATPEEKIVFHKWFLKRYNQHMRDAAARLKKINPDVIIVSEIEVGNFAPMLYEDAVGTYDYITAQQMPAGSANRQKIGFGTKIMADLGETPVQAGAHVEHYFLSLNAEETNEILSEPFRAGAKSLILWLVDWAGKTYTDYYGSPERFAEIKHIFKELGTMGELKQPEADTAVLFSNITRFAENWWFVKSTDPNAVEYESAFTVLGPRIGGAFKFVSDYQIAEKNHDLTRYKTIYVPAARYQDDKTVAKLKAYVENGGTLILGSPDMFGKSDNGSTRPSLQKDFMGVEITGTTASPGKLNYNGLSVASSGREAFILKTLGKAKVIAAYANGNPALVENPVGKGKVITFASNPFSPGLFTNKEAWELFRSLQTAASCKVDEPIWRFRFPRPQAPPPSPWKKGMICVTGNACAWEMDNIVDGPNEPLKFKASYSIAPDLIPDKKPNCGALFNRKAALDQPQLKRKKTIPALQGWAAAWKNKDAFSITIDFPKNLPGGEVKLWCHGDIPAIELYHKGELVGKAVIPDSAESVDVREITIPFKTAAANLELRFAPRSKGDLYIGELEVWTKK